MKVNDAAKKRNLSLADRAEESALKCLKTVCSLIDAGQTARAAEVEAQSRLFWKDAARLRALAQTN